MERDFNQLLMKKILTLSFLLISLLSFGQNQFNWYRQTTYNSSGTDTYTTTINGLPVSLDQVISVNFGNANTSTTPTIAITGATITSAKTIQAGGVALAAGQLQGQRTLKYDGTYWQLQGDGGSGGGGGSGTVNSGTANQLAIYPSTGTTVGGSSLTYTTASNQNVLRFPTTASNGVSVASFLNDTGVSVEFGVLGSAYSGGGSIGTGGSYIYSSDNLKFASGGSYINFGVGVGYPEIARLTASGFGTTSTGNFSLIHNSANRITFGTSGTPTTTFSLPNISVATGAGSSLGYRFNANTNTGANGNFGGFIYTGGALNDFTPSGSFTLDADVNFSPRNVQFATGSTPSSDFAGFFIKNAQYSHVDPASTATTNFGTVVIGGEPVNSTNFTIPSANKYSLITNGKTLTNGLSIRNVANTFNVNLTNTVTADRDVTFADVNGTLPVSDVTNNNFWIPSSTVTFIKPLSSVASTTMIIRAKGTGAVSIDTDGVSSGSAGGVAMTGGAVSGSGTTAGAASMYGGVSSVTGVPSGDAQVFGGTSTAAGASNGGNVLIGAGAPSSGGSYGKIKIQTGTTPTVGMVLTATATDGSADWQAGGAGYFPKTLVANATDANFTATVNGIHNILDGVATANRVITIPTGANGDVMKFFNTENAYTWTFTGATVYLADRSTVVTELLYNVPCFMEKIDGLWIITN